MWYQILACTTTHTPVPEVLSHLCRNLHLNMSLKPIWSCLLTRQKELASTSPAGLTSSPANCPDQACVQAAFSFHLVEEARQLCALCSAAARLDQTNFRGVWATPSQVWTAQNVASGITNLKRRIKLQEPLTIGQELLFKFSSFKHSPNTLKPTSSIFLVFATSQIWLIARILLLNPHSMLSSWKEMEK